jgi:hypothetical protein
VSVQQAEILETTHSNDAFLAAILPGKSLVKGFLLLVDEGGSEDGVCLESTVDSSLGLEDFSGRESGVKRTATVDPEDGRGGTKRHPIILGDRVHQGSGDPNFSSPDLDQTTREARERSATKADDAEVPEYLWIEQMIESNIKVWSEPTRDVLKTQQIGSVSEC